MAVVDLTLPWSPELPPYPSHPSPGLRMFQSMERDRIETHVVETTMHVGTHIDAPKHMAPGGCDVASLSLERLLGPTVVVDLSHVSPWAVLTPEMIGPSLPCSIERGDRVIFYFGWARYAKGGPEEDLERYFYYHPGPHPSLVDWLVEREIGWVGSDAPSFEHPFNVFVQRTRPDLVAEWERQTGRTAAADFPPAHWMYAHRVMGEQGIPHVDQLGGDLVRVAGSRVRVGVFPWRFVGGEASIARAVAFLDPES